MKYLRVEFLNHDYIDVPLDEYLSPGYGSVSHIVEDAARKGFLPLCNGRWCGNGGGNEFYPMSAIKSLKEAGN